MSETRLKKLPSGETLSSSPGVARIWVDDGTKSIWTNIDGTVAEFVGGGGAVAAADITDAGAVGIPLVQATTVAEALTALNLTEVATEAVLSVEVFGPTTDTATGDSAVVIPIPAALNGYNVIDVAANVITAGTTNTTDIQIHRKRGGSSVDVLTTKATIDSTEKSTTTAATAMVVNGSNDDLLTDDELHVDIDAVSTTAAKGLWVHITVQKPLA